MQSSLKERFRGFLPVVIDVETAGFNSATDALLELAVCPIEMDEDGHCFPGEVAGFHVVPFEGANLDPKSLEFTGIDPYHPLRLAQPEDQVLGAAFKPVRQALKRYECTRAVLVGHNAHFDLAFLNAAVERCGIKRNPFHPFSCFDTASLSGLALGQTVLARACKAAGIEFDGHEAHSARYDTARTADLFCAIVNRWKELGGWPPPLVDDEA
ncbi:MAG: ribonuclease T [Litorivicinus sp.]